MKATKREKVKMLIRMSPNADAADEVINENFNFGTIGEKIAFLKGMFDVEIISVHDADEIGKDESDKMSYWVMLDYIVNYYN